jgi:hypothetical protein
MEKQTVSTELILTPTAQALAVPTVFAGPAQAEWRFWEFFTPQISNDNKAAAGLPVGGLTNGIKGGGDLRPAADN